MAAATMPLTLAANDRERAINPWLIAITVTLATFMELLDTAIANVSLPHIAGGLATSYDEATWVLTSYLVANAVVLPLSAWLSRVFGRKNYYMACVALFTLSSLLCGFSASLGLLIFFRVLQGIAGGGLAPVEQAILVDTFPASKRAAAFALYSMAIVTAPAVGPPLGGWITDSFSWRWIFFINVPIGILSLVLTSRMLSDPPEFKREVEAARNAGKLKIDYIGIMLIAIGFACLEVVLDRGERLDWFDSDFIVSFFAIAIVALVIAIFWELRHPDPVVEIRLLKERNFAIANVYYFLFGFVLFGSTVLIPQMLQSLYGYTATDAGLVLGPGAMVIVVLAPVVVRLVSRIPVSRLLALGFGILALAMWYFASFNLATNYARETGARALQGLGIAFLFVPATQLAYSYLPKEKNNKASSLTNLFRNQGGSFGIASVTTLLSRRMQYHQTVLVTHITNFDQPLRATVAGIANRLVEHGSSIADASASAVAQVYALVQQQAAMLAFLDCFRILGVVAAIGAPLAIFIRKFNQGGSAAAH
ncbi:MAG TPA: DHA2 family efflux MFS transporter permease subunit [Candidatus Sulfotelmatobacter sp.]|nr:DHA2 family efflux MFS transporter permease subunit [Candidatus Sulfotelmatobacter sp.]